jgi:hypothetical protein
MPGNILKFLHSDERNPVHEEVPFGDSALDEEEALSLSQPLFVLLAELVATGAQLNHVPCEDVDISEFPRSGETEGEIREICAPRTNRHLPSRLCVGAAALPLKFPEGREQVPCIGIESIVIGTPSGFAKYPFQNGSLR